jgi:hypothetical protein
LIEIIN